MGAASRVRSPCAGISGARKLGPRPSTGHGLVVAASAPAPPYAIATNTVRHIIELLSLGVFKKWEGCATAATGVSVSTLQALRRPPPQFVWLEPPKPSQIECRFLTFTPTLWVRTH